MRRLLLILILSTAAWCQNSTSGNITAANASCTATACISLQGQANVGSASVVITGTWTATLQFETSGDNGTTWSSTLGYPVSGASPVTSTAANGTWQLSMAGLTDIRVRASAFTSGPATISIVSATSSFSANSVPGGSSGQLQYNNAGVLGGISNATTDGTNITSQTNSGTITSTMGTVTVDTKMFTGSMTLNNGAITFKPWFLNFTCSAAAAASRLFEIDVASSSVFNVDCSGNVIIAGTLTTGGSAGYLALGQGTCPTSLNANTMYDCTPASITTSYTKTWPGAEPSAAGVILVGAAASHATTFTYGLVPLTDVATQAADSVVMNASGSTASPTAIAMPTSGTNGCAGASNALQYNTTTHALGCGTISASSTNGVIYYAGVQGSEAGDSTDKTMTNFTYTMPANTLTTGHCLDIQANFTHTTGSTTTLYKITFGATDVSTPATNTSTNASAMYATVCADSTTTQNAVGESKFGTSWNTDANSTPGETLNSGTVIIKATFNVANTNSVTPKMFTVTLR